MPNKIAVTDCRGKHSASGPACGRQRGTGSGTGLWVAILVPADNEAGSIGATLDGLMSQVRRPDRIVVIPNGCTGGTARGGRKHPATVLEPPRLAHRKSEALNRG